MGFISSILCCSSDSSQVASKRNSRQLNPRTQQQQQQQVQRVQKEGSPYPQKHTSNSGEVTATKNTSSAPYRQGTRATREYNYEGDRNVVRQSLPRNISSKNNQEFSKMDTHLKSGDVNAKNDNNDGNNINNNSLMSRSDGKVDKREDESFIKSRDEIREKERERDKEITKNDSNGEIGVSEDSEKERDFQSNYANRNNNHRPSELEKQGVYVYTGDTDTSTGGSSYDRHSQFPPSTGTTNTTTTTNSNQLSHSHTPSHDLQETTTTVHEGENASSADDTDVPLQQSRSHEDEADPDMDVDMAPPYDDEEFVDLTELQPGQFHAPGFGTLLPPQSKSLVGKKCLVLDLDETLVHSSFKYLKGADFVLPVDIDDQIHNVYVLKRPGVDEFLKKVGSLFEVVIFTASVARYGDPLLDILDKHHCVHHRLFREACYNYEGNYIKNLSQIGRPLSEIIILDNSPASYIFHPQHAIPISSWFSDTHDNELLDIIPLLEDLSEQSVPDIGKVLDITI